MQGIGFVFNVLGDAAMFVASVFTFPCRFIPGVAGSICNHAAGGLFEVIGTIQHTIGDVTTFSGRLMVDGWVSALGLDYLPGWIDIDTIDLQKIASYRCKYDTGISDINSLAWLDCPGIDVLILDFFYVLLTGIVCIFLMMTWLSYIPILSHALTGGTSYISSRIWGENILSGSVKKVADFWSKKK